MSLWIALAAGLLLAAATPPAWFPGAELLVLPGLAAFYAVATRCRRPLLGGYLAGALHMAWFSFSLRHVLWFGYAGVILAGGLYYLLAVAGTRCAARPATRCLAFAAVVAGTQALRAVMPEIHYPHGQPAHALYLWPVLMGPVRWAGEPLLNALLALVAAAAFELAAARGRAPSVALAMVCALGVYGVTAGFAPPGHEAAAAAPLRIVALEPGFGPSYGRPHSAQELRDGLLRPTIEVAGPDAVAPPDLVLWPESTWPWPLRAGADGEVRTLGGHDLRLHRAVRLAVGTELRRDGGPSTPTGLVLDHRGEVVGLHEKRRLVPGGEFLPGSRWLPSGLRQLLLDAVAAAMGVAPDCQPGAARALPMTAGGTPFGVQICYDNAFPEIAAEQVAAGARLLAVLSNESWYLRGGELAQMEALSVCRALETATPVVRSTSDGSTCAIDRHGRWVDGLSWRGASPRAPRRLQVELAPGPGALGPLAWLHPSARVLALLLAFLPLWRALGIRARLLQERSGQGQPTPTVRGGSVP